MTTPHRPPIPVTVVGGYLGAGKTTLLNRLLRHAAGTRFAVLVNDFGAINIDAELIESFDGETMQLANGCICCSLAGGFAETLFAVRDLEPRPDRVLVEASGVADPMATAQYAHLDGFVLDGVIVVADAETVRGRVRDRYVGRHVAEQLAQADLVVLNKVDLLDPGRLERLRRWIVEESGAARVIEAERGEVPVEFLFGAGAPGRSHRRGAALEDHPDHDTWSFESSVPVAADRWSAIVDALPTSVVRGKGIVFVADDPLRRFVFQSVGRRWTMAPGESWGTEQPRTRLAFVGLPGNRLTDELTRCFQEYSA